jgi:hypothetical protein
VNGACAAEIPTRFHRSTRVLLAVRRARTSGITRTIDELEGISGRLSRLTPINRGNLFSNIVRGLGIGLILGAIGSYLQAKADRDQIENDLRRIENDVRSFILKKSTTSLIAKSQLAAEKDQRVFIYYEIEIHHGMPRFGKYRYPDGVTISAWLAPTGIDVLVLSDLQKRIRSGVTREGYNPEKNPTIESYPQFAEVSVYTTDEMNAFHELSELYFSLDRRSKFAFQDYELAEQLEEVKTEIVRRFGKDIWFLD